MKKQLGLLLLFVFFGIGSTVLAQRGGGGSNPSVSFVPTITYATCFNPNGNVEYEIVVSSEWENEASLNRLDMYNDVPELVFTTTDPNLVGTIGTTGIGIYTISGSISALNSNGMWVGIPFSATIWVGIETSWAELIDMAAIPNNYSTTRSVVSAQTFGASRSFNSINSGDGWIQMRAGYGSSTSSNVYLVIGNTKDLTLFAPGASIQYLELYNTSSGSGVRVKHQVAGGTYSTTNLSIGINETIRVVRKGSTLTIQKGTSSSTVFTLPEPYTGPMNIGVFTSVVNDAALDVISSFPCEYDNHYHYLKSSVEESIAYINGDLKFKFEEDYFDSGETLEYEIRDINGSSVTPLTGVLDKTLGVDFYTLDIGPTGHNLSSGEIYLITVVNEKGVKSFLKFKVA